MRYRSKFRDLLRLKWGFHTTFVSRWLIGRCRDFTLAVGTRFSCHHVWTGRRDKRKWLLQRCSPVEQILLRYVKTKKKLHNDLLSEKNELSSRLFIKTFLSGKGVQLYYPSWKKATGLLLCTSLNVLYPKNQRLSQAWRIEVFHSLCFIARKELRCFRSSD